MMRRQTAAAAQSCFQDQGRLLFFCFSSPIVISPSFEEEEKKKRQRVPTMSPSEKEKRKRKFRRRGAR